MRFFTIACVFCGLIASVGCMTNNWSAPMFKEQNQVKNAKVDVVDKDDDTKASFWKTKFGSSAGIDPRAREIEKRLGL